jgi:tripartite-type tricarboxylate transporter receptor subunit TctC
MAKLPLQHVPYRGSAQAITDLIGKRIDLMIDPPTAQMELIRKGTLRALGVTGETRFFGLPDVPTIAEAGLPGYVVTSWQGLAGPTGIPPSVVERLNSEIAAVLAEPAVVDRLRTLGNEPRPSSPDAFKARVAADIEKWSNVVSGAKIERL